MVILIREKCIHCGACRQYCPVDGAIVTDRGRMKIVRERCTNCGRCIKACYERAIRTVSDEQAPAST